MAYIQWVSQHRLGGTTTLQGAVAYDVIPFRIMALVSIMQAK